MSNAKYIDLVPEPMRNIITGIVLNAREILEKRGSLEVTAFIFPSNGEILRASPPKNMSNEAFSILLKLICKTEKAIAVFIVCEADATTIVPEAGINLNDIGTEKIEKLMETNPELFKKKDVAVFSLETWACAAIAMSDMLQHEGKKTFGEVEFEVGQLLGNFTSVLDPEVCYRWSIADKIMSSIKKSN